MSLPRFGQVAPTAFRGLAMHAALTIAVVDGGKV